MSDLLRKLFGLNCDAKPLDINQQAQNIPEQSQKLKTETELDAQKTCTCGAAQQNQQLQPVWLWAPFKLTYHRVPTPEEQLLTDVLQSISYCPELQQEHFNVSVKDSDVELWGAVTSEQNSKLAWRMAMETPGVRKVVNRLALLERN